MATNSDTPKVRVTISNRTAIRVLSIVIGSFILLGAIQKASHALTLLFIALFLSLALNAPVQALAVRLPGKRKGNRSLATALSFFLIIGLFAGFIASFAPSLVKQTSNFIDDAPRLIEDLHDENTSTGSLVRKYKLEDQLDKLSSQLSD